MPKLANLEPGQKELYATNFYSADYQQDLYLKKANANDALPKYYLSVYTMLNNTLVQQGYLYFYLDETTKKSYFIGLYVFEEFRNLNIGSFLIASWIDLCLNNGYDFLGTNKKQRKPFLLYLLKTYGFEIMNKNLYASRDDVITICRNVDKQDKSKILVFKDPKHQQRFQQTNVFKDDNYLIKPSVEGLITLDQVIIPLQDAKTCGLPYDLSDYDQAEAKVHQIIHNHRK